MFSFNLKSSQRLSTVKLTLYFMAMVVHFRKHYAHVYTMASNLSERNLTVLFFKMHFHVALLDVIRRFRFLNYSLHRSLQTLQSLTEFKVIFLTDYENLHSKLQLIDCCLINMLSYFVICQTK